MTTSTGYYLLDKQNPNAAVRGDGRRFFGHSDRGGQAVRIIGVHTAENLPDMNPPDLGAEKVANYFATTSRAASAHENVDSDSTVVLLPASYTAFAARGWNQKGWHIELCTQARKWDDLPDAYRAALIERAARRCALVAAKFGIPPVRITLTQANAGSMGFMAHADIDPSRRTDPGVDFPWDHFLSRVRAYITEHDDMPDTGSVATTDRVSGPDRYATAVEVAKLFFTPGETDTVLLARGDTSGVDAIAAAQGTAPVLLVSELLPAATADALAYFRPARVIAVGGTGAVSDDVLNAAARAARR